MGRAEPARAGDWSDPVQRADAERADERRSIRSASTACSSAGRGSTGTDAAARAAGGSPPRAAAAARRRARLADEASSHWTSSIAMSTGSRSASASSAVRTATASVRKSTGSSVRLAQEQGDLERAPARRRRAPGRTSSRTLLEQVSERGVGEPRSSSAGREDSTRKSARAGRLVARRPERRLADPRLALEHECGTWPSIGSARGRRCSEPSSRPCPTPGAVCHRGSTLPRSCHDRPTAVSVEI